MVRGAVATHFFDVLGIQPALGRFFRTEDAEPGAPPVAIISHELWRDAFGSDQGVLGRSVTIDQHPHLIVGVAPGGMTLPTSDTRLWSPVRVASQVAANGADVRVELTRAIARLTPGATPRHAATEGTALARTAPRPVAAEMLFGKGGPVEVHARTLVDEVTHRVRPALLVLLTGVGLLLSIACANVASLFLSRGVSRERDLAVRVALGAGRARLMRETLVEALVTSLAAGVLGLALAWALLVVLPIMTPTDFPRLDAIRLDWGSVIVAIALSLGAATVTSLVPALRSARRNLVPALREAAGASHGPRALFAHRVLLVAEASLAVLLLTGASLMGRSFFNLVQTDTGYDASGVLTARIYLPGASRGQAETGAFVSDLLTRVRALPGVTAAGVSNMAPFGRSTYVSAFEIPVPGRAPVVARALSYVVTPGYGEALRLRRRKGRLLESSDVASNRQAVLVNEEFARTFLADIEPVGLRFEGQFGPAEIVGVVGNVLKDSLEQPPQAEMYVAATSSATIRREIYLLLRTAGDPVAYVDVVRQTVADLRRDAAVDAIEPLRRQLMMSVAQPRFAAAILASLAGVALALAAVGLYGVLSYVVARRQREIGVRSALGATRGRIIAMIVHEGMTVIMLGLVVGLAAAAGLARFMQSLLIGVEPIDVPSFSAAAGVLILFTLAATYVPARRAARVDPVVAMRVE
jgi:predicted permease